MPYEGRHRRHPSYSRRSMHQEESLISRKYLLYGSISMIFVPAIAIIASFVSPHNPASATLSHRIMHSTKQSRVYTHPYKFPKPPYALFSTKVVLPSHKVQPAYILINENGTIAGVTKSLAATPSRSRGVIVDVSPLVVMPGLIDPHVHINEPGRADWEGYYPATRAAAAGGTTTILDMPLNNIPATTTAAALTDKLKALAAASSFVDIGLIGGVVHGNTDNIQELIDGGVVALKSFMVDSQSKDFPHVSREDLAEAMEELERLTSKGSKAIKPIPYILHAELDDEASYTGQRASSMETYDHTSYDHFELSRPDSWETNAIRVAAELANKTEAHIHIAHVSSHAAVRYISELRDSPLFRATITAETCTHYLVWAKEEIAPGSTRYKCTPPIRSRDNRDRMRESLFTESKYNNAIDLIASDHSPCPDEMKETSGNITKAWGGISGLQYRLHGSWSAAKNSSAGVAMMAKLLAEAPARVFGLDDRKGFLRSGFDADIVIWNPKRKSRLTEEGCYHLHKGSSFHDASMDGLIAYTLLRGEAVYSRAVYDKRKGHFGDARGRLLYRSSEDGIIRSEDRQNWRNVHEPGE